MKKFNNRCLQSVLLALFLLIVISPANAADNLVAVADKAGTFKTLLAAAKAAGLAHTLQEDGPFTVFAPTDDAFAKLPKHTLDDLLKPENKEKLATILKYHVLSGKITAKNAVQLGSAKTFAGDSVTISIQDGRLTVNNATVILNDLEASNGIIHVIDSVLIPAKPKNIVETASASGNFQTLLAAVEAAGLVETLQGHGPFTVFAPSDKAFETLGQETLLSLLKPESKHKLQAILKYHVVSGRLSVDDIEHLKAIKTAQGAEVRVKVDPFADPGPGLAINHINIISGDIDAGNGIIHVIDSVLMPPKPKNIVETAAAAGTFKTLITAVKAAGLADTLQGEGPFTFLAPSDDAFAKLPHGAIESLLKPESKHELEAILKNHVIPGRISQSRIFGLLKTGKWLGYRTLAGTFVNPTKRDGRLVVNDANVIANDLEASNGIIHVIDSVLMPPEQKNDIAAVAKRSGQFDTLLAAVDAAGLDGVLTGTSPVTVFAPTDAAFKALPKGTVETLLKPENKKKLQSILSLHVVKGAVAAGDALNARSTKSVSGGGLEFGINEGVFKVNGVTIIKTDIKCSNGVIHVIDAVLLPAAEKTSSHSSAMSPVKQIEAAVKKGEMPRLIGSDQHYRVHGIINFSKQNHGDIHRFRVKGATHGTVWGSGVYTSDSHLGVAAVHAGILKDGETGVVIVRIVDPPSSFGADKRHGVSTHAWGHWDGAFEFLMDSPMSTKRAHDGS
ncbi:MAG: fasciclin domain-containing protein [Rubripirellula sp.]